MPPDLLFERSGALLASSHRQLIRLFQHELLVLEKLLSTNLDDRWLNLVAEAGIACEMIVRHLLREASKRVDQNPREALLMFSASAAMTRTLPDTDPLLSSALLGHAMKGRANAFRHLGEFEAALADLKAAARHFDDAKYCVSEAGQVVYTCGTVLFKMERWDEAIVASQKARALFIRADDVRRTAYADLLEAGSLFETGDVEAARTIWLKLLGILNELNDRETLARVWQNLGACEIRRRQRADARRWLVSAATAFRDLGNETELARVRWNMATYTATFGDKRRGIRALRCAQHSFTALGLWGDAACAGLEAIELMLRTTVPSTALTWYAEEIANVLLRLGMEKSAAVALDQLRRIATVRDRDGVLRDIREALGELNAPCQGEAGGASGLVLP